MGSLTYAHIWVCAVHTKGERGGVGEGGGGGVRHKQACTRVDSEGQERLSLTQPQQGIEPRVLGFEF